MPNYDLIQSVGRALDILELVGNYETGMSLRYVMDRTSLKEPTAHNLLRTLVAKGFLIKRRHPIRYYPGPVMVYFRRSMRDYDLFERAKPIMMNLTSTFGGNTRLCEYVGMCTLGMLTSSPGQAEVMRLRLPLYMLPYGIGSVFQAYWDKHQKAYYEKNFSFAQYGKNAWKSRDRFKRFLTEFRKNRVGMIPIRLTGEHFRVAAPIFGPRGDMVAMVCFMKPLKETTAAFRRKCCEAVRNAGVELSFAG